MNGLSFLPESNRKKREDQQRVLKGLLYLIAAAFVISVLFVFPLHKLHRLEVQHTLQKSAIKKDKKENKATELKRKLSIDAYNHVEVGRRLSGKPFMRTIQIAEQYARQNTEIGRIHLEVVSLRDHVVHVQGSSTSSLEVVEYLKALEKSEALGIVRLTYWKAGKEKEGGKFSIRIHLKKD